MPIEDFIDTKPDSEERVSGWIVTFADLMALLMCFFVLLLSFSSMDVEKYKRMAESMRNTFGVPSHMPADGATSPDGAIEAQPTQIPAQAEPSAVCVAPAEAKSEADDRNREAEQTIIDKVAALVGETERDAIALATALSKEIAAGVLEVETNGRKIVLRVKEHGSFASGSSSLTNDFKPVLKIIRGVLKDTKGQIAVEGHTDDVPISTSAFRSNLELSSSRAISVAHGLFENGTLDQQRFTVAGYADSRPLVPNNTPEGRVKNRRIEVVIQQGLGDVKQDLDALHRSDAEGFDRVRAELMRRFDLKPDEIY